MKSTNIRNNSAVATPVLALLFAMGVVGSVNAGPPEEKPGKGPQASIDISASCSLEMGILTVETRIVDKTVDKLKGGTEPTFPMGESGMVTPQYKSRGPVWQNLAPAYTFVPRVTTDDSPIVTYIDLCADGISGVDATSIGAEVSVEVTNSKDASWFSSKCSEKIDASGVDFVAICN